MKKILIILSLFCYFNNLVAQIMVGEPYYFCALNGSCYNDNERKVTIEENEYTNDEIIHLTEQFQNIHPEFEIIEPTSMRYNCHGYAYSVYQGGERLWIQWGEDLCNYNGMQYYSYVEIPEHEVVNGDIATIIDTTVNNYSPHSSIVYNKDTLISKFAYTPLFRHHKYDAWIVQETGLNSSSVYTYYRRVANAQINGPEVFDGNATYTFVPNVIPESCSWKVEPAEMFQQSSGNGYNASLSYKSNLSYLSPKAVLIFTFKYGCENTYTVKKEIDLTIPTSTLSGTITSEGFIVDNDATVTIIGEIKTVENAKIIIKPGGKLIVDGGVITKAHNEGKWQGIQVWGNDSMHQSPENGKYHQGILELKNGATIENAVCAVDLWNPLDNHSEGGIVWAADATFRNNAKSVRALNYSNYSPSSGVESKNMSWFRKCSFVVDSAYVGNDAFHNHVELNNVDGFKFIHCSFSVDNYSSETTTSAIYANSAGFTVDYECDPISQPCPEANMLRSSFDGFDDAIYVTNSGNSARTFLVRGAEFSDNTRGVHAVNSGYATIIQNNIIVGSKASSNIGIYLEHVTNFCIEENNFTSSKKAGSYGIVIENSASYNDIYRNTFTNLQYGNMAYGLNVVSGNPSLGLTYTCNTNSGNINDFGVMREGSIGIIGNSQGSSSLAAANTFSATNYNFYNNGSNVVTYYYKGTGNKIPSKNYRLRLAVASSDNECKSHYATTPGGSVMMSLEDIDFLKKKYTTALNSYNSLKNISETKIDNESEISMLQREYLLAAGDIVRSNLHKEERNFTELREWLDKSDDMTSTRMIIASYIQQGDFVNALSLAKTLPETYNLQGEDLEEYYDYMEMIRLYENLHESKRSVLQLSNNEMIMINDIAENGRGDSQEMAKALIAGNNGFPTIIIGSYPTIPMYGTAVRGISDDNHDMYSFDEMKFDIVPNPATKRVDVDYILPNDEIKAELVVTNTLGIKVLTTELFGRDGTVSLDIENLPAGLYLYSVRCGDKIMTGKLMKE